jgi:hypothetical protein
MIEKSSSDMELAGSTFTTMFQGVEDSYCAQEIAARLLQIFGWIGTPGIRAEASSVNN